MASDKHVYVDSAAVGSNNGTSPANAYVSLEVGISNEQYNLDTDTYIWVKRTHLEPEANVSQDFDVYGWGSGQEDNFKLAVVGWPISTDPFYDFRPAAGTSAGWDGDSTSAIPTVDFGQAGWELTTRRRCWLSRYEWSRIRFETGAGYDLAYTSYGYIQTSFTARFYECQFVYNATADFRPGLIGIGENDAGYVFGQELYFEKCYFEHNTYVGDFGGVLNDGNAFFLPDAPSSVAARANVTCVDCTFVGGAVPVTATDYGGAVVSAYDYRWFYGTHKFHFIGCDFTGLTAGYKLVRIRVMGGFGPVESPDIRFIGCDFGANGFAIGTAPETPSFVSAYQTQAFLTVEAYKCANSGVASDWIYDTGLFRLTHDTTTVNDSPVSIKWTPRAEMGLYVGAATVGPSSKYFFYDGIMWPHLKRTNIWCADVTATSVTITIKAMFRNWVSLPTSNEFYFLTHEITGTGASAGANLVFSTEAPIANDTWTTFTLTLTSAVATRLPIHAVFKTYEAGADILIDPTLTVT